MNIPELNKKIKEVVDFKADGSVNKFSAMIGISQQKVNRLFNIDTRTNKYPAVPSDILMSITESFVEINAEWLLSNRGEMLKKEEGDIKRAPSNQIRCSNCEVLKERLKEKERIIEVMESSINDKNEIIALLKQQAARRDSMERERGKKTA